MAGVTVLDNDLSSRLGRCLIVLNLLDSASGDRYELAPRTRGQVSIYVCGPTVYDVPHLGHGRSALVYDILRRYLAWSGFTVDFVSNITDIDDKIIARASEQGRSPAEVAAEYEEAWWSACDLLGVQRPAHSPHATEYVQQMVELIAELIKSGHAYEAPGGVWFSPESVAGYGLLAHQSIDSLRSGARVEVDESKRSPIDFALWKLAKEGEPSSPSPWGAGRPGWHTECVVMSLGLLGDGFDLHAGGMDLQFPHHENERAQAVALGKSFAHRWMHHAFVEVGGEKMSKSLGNYTSLTDLLEREDPRALRLLVLRAHYRSPMEVDQAAIADATDALGRLDSLARRLTDLTAVASPDEARRTDEETLARFRERMDDDLDTPGAIAVLFETIRRANAAADSGDTDEASRLGATALEMGAAVGVEPSVEQTSVIEAGATIGMRTTVKMLVLPASTPEEIQELIARRDRARHDRDFAAADALRDELTAKGWVIEDGSDRTALRRSN